MINYTRTISLPNGDEMNMSRSRGFFFWAAAVTSGIAMGGALALSTTPVVAAYIGAAIPLVIAVTAILSRKEHSDDGESHFKAFPNSVVAQVSGFVFVFFLATLAAAAVGMSIRPTESLIASVNRDLRDIGITKQKDRTPIIVRMLESGALTITGDNTRSRGAFLYSSPNNSAAREPRVHTTI